MTHCSTCGRRGSERIAPDPRRPDEYMTCCSDVFHDLADLAPEAFEMVKKLLDGYDVDNLTTQTIFREAVALLARAGGKEEVHDE